MTKRDWKNKEKKNNEEKIQAKKEIDEEIILEEENKIREKEKENKEKDKCQKEKVVVKHIPYSQNSSKIEKKRQLAQFNDIFKQYEITMRFSKALQ